MSEPAILVIKLGALGNVILSLSAFAAIAQKNFKRLLAYSSIGHMGYALIGLAAGTVEGVTGVLIYLATYVAMSAGAFACVVASHLAVNAVAIWRTSSSSNGFFRISSRSVVPSAETIRSQE